MSIMDGSWGQARDRRREQRVPVDVEARALPGGYPCRILDLSPSGARIRMPAGLLPATFVLVEWSTGRAHQAQVRWREGPELGVRFLRSCDLRGMVPRTFVDAKAMWMRRDG